MTAPVSIVIPVHNGRSLLEKLLESIARQTAAPLEVIVVDNGSSDGAPDSARSAGARVIAMGRNTGFAAAVNRGIREAQGEGIALINCDVELDTRWLEVLWDATCAGDAHFGTGTILQADSQNILDGAFDLVCRGGSAWRAGAGQPASVLPDALPIQFCSATAALYRADLFRAVGLFEEAFESYLEDVDFGLRCAAAGFRGGYFPEAVCWHHGSATFGRWSPRVVRLIARNQVFLIARHYPRQLMLRWLWPILTAQALWGALALRHGCGFAWLGGKAEGVWRAGAVAKAPPVPELEAILIESERQIQALQSGNGFDWYWKYYFRLAGGAK